MRNYNDTRQTMIRSLMLKNFFVVRSCRRLLFDERMWNSALKADSFIQIYVYSQSQYGLPFRGLSLHQQRTENTGWLKDRVLKPAGKLSLVVSFVPS